MAQLVRYTAAVPSTVSNIAWMFIKISQRKPTALVVCRMFRASA